MKSKLKEKGFKSLGNDNIPSVPWYIGEDNLGVQLEERLFDEGIYLPIVRYPASEYNRSRFRIIVMTNHKKNHLDQLIKACSKIGKELRII